MTVDTSTVIPFNKGSRIAKEQCEPGLVMLLDGTLQWLKADGTLVPVPGSGGSQPGVAVGYRLSSITVPAGDYLALDWTARTAYPVLGADDLLDFTDPALPVFAGDGSYIAQLIASTHANIEPTTSGATFGAEIDAIGSEGGLTLVRYAPISYNAGSYLAGAYVEALIQGTIEAGVPLTTWVGNGDSVDHPFDIYLIVTKVADAETFTVEA